MKSIDASESRWLKIKDVSNNFANGGINYLLTVSVNYLLTDSEWIVGEQDI